MSNVEENENQGTGNEHSNIEENSNAGTDNKISNGDRK
jgi:hypothetical protein